MVAAGQTNPLASARALAKSHLHKVLRWLFVSLVLSVLFGWISAWAGDRTGWEGQFVQVVFGLAGTLAFLTFLMFCVLLYSWISGYKSALRDASELESDRELYLYIHRDVFGPIPWG